MMNKPTFQAALKQAQQLQGTYKIEQSRCDELYKALKDEDEQAVVDALKRLGKTDKIISYFNIMAFIDEYRPREKPPLSKWDGDDRPIGEIYKEFPPEVKKIFDNLTNKKKMGR